MVRNILLFGIAIGLLAASATAQNIVQNPAFSTGNFADWNTHTCSSGCSDQGWEVATPLPTGQSGTIPPGASAAAINLCVGVPCNDPVNGDWISQTLTTVPGQTYTLSFYYDGGEDSSTGTTELETLWNGVAVTGGTIINAPSNTWRQYSFTVVATGTSTVLEFTGRQDPATLYLTDISVTSGTGTPTTPAPTTSLLIVTGLVGLALYQFRGKLLPRRS
jgi:hypothetical protein